MIKKNQSLNKGILQFVHGFSIFVEIMAMLVSFDWAKFHFNK